MAKSSPVVSSKSPPRGAEHERTLDLGCPHQRTAGDEAELLEHGIATLLGGLDHALVALRAEGDAVGGVDARVAQEGDGPRDRTRELLVVVAEHDRVVRALRRDAADAGRRVAVEDRVVLGSRRVPPRRVDHRREVR